MHICISEIIMLGFIIIEPCHCFNKVLRDKAYMEIYMKIGMFAQRNNVSIDTIRHYMNLELIIPQKINKQYDFDSRCQKNFDDIIYLKSLGFNLAEIKNIFMIKQLGKMTSFHQNNYYKDIFTSKLDTVNKELENLKIHKNILEEEISRMESPDEIQPFTSGVDLSWLNLICCLHCGEYMVLKKAVVTDNMVINGMLKCKCGCEYLIKNGVLVIETEDYTKPAFPDIMSYIQNTDNEYLSNMYKTLEWNYSNIDFKEFEDRVIMELGCGIGFFLRKIYNDLPETSVYIAIDKDIDKINSLKAILEKSTCRKNIFYISCDFSMIPLHPKSVDVVCDYSGTSNYSFEHKEFLLKILNKYFKNPVTLLSSYLIFRKFGSNSAIKPDHRGNFQLEQIKAHLEEMGFTRIADYSSAIVTKGGIYEDYFNSNEKVYTYSFKGKRLG